MFVRPDGRGASSREKEPEVRGPGREPGDGGPAEKTGRSIRCAAEIRPLEEPDPVSSLRNSGRAPALHACKYLTMPVLESYPFG